MYDILNTVTGETMTCYADRRQAQLVAAPMEFHRVIDMSHQGYMYTHLPRQRWGQEHPHDKAVHEHLQQRIVALIAEAETRSYDDR